MTFKPKPKQPVLDVLKRQEKVTELPTLGRGTGRGRALSMTQINIRCSEDMALIFSRLANEAGSSRMALAKLLVDAGYEDVSTVDRNTQIQVRRYRREIMERQEAAERRRRS
jgi:hypothetical protein